ncbi:hypothetical protein PSPO01_09543 [Paraphaeosphaeria sporulosa]
MKTLRLEKGVCSRLDRVRWTDPFLPSIEGAPEREQWCYRFASNVSQSSRWHRKCLEVGGFPPERSTVTALHCSRATKKGDILEILSTGCLSNLQLFSCFVVPPQPGDSFWTVVDGVRTTLFKSLHCEEAVQRSHGFLEAFGNACWGTLKQEVCPLAVGSAVQRRPWANVRTAFAYRPSRAHSPLCSVHCARRGCGHTPPQKARLAARQKQLPADTTHAPSPPKHPSNLHLQVLRAVRLPALRRSQDQAAVVANPERDRRTVPPPHDARRLP